MRKQARIQISDEQFINAVSNTASAAEMLRCMGRVPAGGNYKTLHSRIHFLGLDTSHWVGQAHLRGKKHNWGKKAPLESVLVQQSSYRGGSYKLKRRLVNEALLTESCGVCGLVEWLGAAIALHLDHKNGDNKDNRLENLRLLCPNCHSQTTTYCGKNKRLLRIAQARRPKRRPAFRNSY